MRAASFIHEDTTTSTSIFQQAKDRFSGVGPVGGIGLSYLLSQCQFYGLIDAGEMFGAAGQFVREMAVLNSGTRIISDAIRRSENVAMLGVQAGMIFYSSNRVSLGIGYRFDQWWNLVRLRGGVVNWTNNAFDFQIRWRL